MCIVSWLSQDGGIRVGTGKHNSYRKCCNQVSLLVVWAITLYSTSALDLATTLCFLLFHVTGFAPQKAQYPMVNLLFEGDPAQSASVKTSTLRWPFFLNNMPRPRAIFKYRTIQIATSQCESLGDFLRTNLPHYVRDICPRDSEIIELPNQSTVSARIWK
jgi:hypothetical protein